MKSLFLLLVAVVCVLSFESDLVANDAKVLPETRWRLQIFTSYSSIENRFENNGAISRLGSRYSTELNRDVLTTLQPQHAEVFHSLLGENGSLGFLDISTNAELLTNIFTAEYGITKRLSIGVMIPLITARNKVHVHQTDSRAAAQLSEQLPPSAQNALKQIRQQLSVQSLERVLQNDFEYQGGFQDWSATGLGDIELGLKYQFVDRTRWRSAIKGGFRAPTGHTDRANELFDIGFGDGQWDIAAYHYLDYQAHPDLFFTLETGYTLQLPDRISKKIPLSEAIPISNQTENIAFNLGDKLETSLQLHFRPISATYMRTKYRYLIKFADSYSTNQSFASEILEQHTSQELHQLQAELGYSNLSAIRNKQATIPFEAAAFYHYPLAGKNTYQTQTLGLILKTYF